MKRDVRKQVLVCSYITATLEAYQRHLVSRANLRKVVDSAKDDFVKALFLPPSQPASRPPLDFVSSHRGVVFSFLPSLSPSHVQLGLTPASSPARWEEIVAAEAQVLALIEAEEKMEH